MGKDTKSKKKRSRRDHGSALGIAAIFFSILFLAGLFSLGALYYINRQKAAPISPERVENSSPAENQTQLPQETDTAVLGSADESAEESSSEQESTQKESTEEESTGEETTEAPTEEPDPDLELKEKVLESYTNLGVITGVRNYLNMRRGPSTDTDIVGVIFKNCAVEIVEEKDGWMEIRSGGAMGYVSAEYVTTGKEARKIALSSMVYRAEVLTDTLQVHTEASEESDVITTILKGERYDVNGFKGDWVNVEAVVGLNGYVHKDYISAGYFLDEAIVFSFDGVSETRQDIIRKAFEYYGGTYEWGGKVLKADGQVDCSGYVMCIYKMFDILLPEFSGAQAEQGATVNEETIRPGDLIFYVGRYPGQIGHVAIYIGNGKIIHAASESKGICVSSWKFVPPVVIKNVIGD